MKQERKLCIPYRLTKPRKSASSGKWARRFSGGGCIRRLGAAAARPGGNRLRRGTPARQDRCAAVAGQISAGRTLVEIAAIDFQLLAVRLQKEIERDVQSGRSSRRLHWFNAGSYPGDALMQDWWSNSPYQFAGYYLNAPCHRNFTPWEGNRSNLIGMGWTLLLIYVGQQRPPQPGQNGCDQNNLTNAQGVADAIDAAQRATNDGFTAGTYIYLDIETGDPFDTDLSAYLSGWVPQIVNSGFGIGVYCSRNIAADVNNFIATILPSNTAPPRFSGIRRFCPSGTRSSIATSAVPPIQK